LTWKQNRSLNYNLSKKEAAIKVFLTFDNLLNSVNLFVIIW